jgi:hypothetical protein
MTDEATSTEALKPIVVRSDEGDAHLWFGNLAVIKTTADESAGQLTIVEVTAPPLSRCRCTCIAATTKVSGSSRGTSRSRSPTPRSRRTQATTSSGRAISRTAQPSGTMAAACFSSWSRRQTWCGWSFEWDATAGEHELTCRATDATRNVQPLEPPCNYQGMGNNVVQRVVVVVVVRRRRGRVEPHRPHVGVIAS